MRVGVNRGGRRGNIGWMYRKSLTASTNWRLSPFRLARNETSRKSLGLKRTPFIFESKDYGSNFHLHVHVFRVQKVHVGLECYTVFRKTRLDTWCKNCVIDDKWLFKSLDLFGDLFVRCIPWSKFRHFHLMRVRKTATARVQSHVLFFVFREISKKILTY